MKSTEDVTRRNPGSQEMPAAVTPGEKEGRHRPARWCGSPLWCTCSAPFSAPHPDQPPAFVPIPRGMVLGSLSFPAVKSPGKLIHSAHFMSAKTLLANQIFTTTLCRIKSVAPAENMHLIPAIIVKQEVLPMASAKDFLARKMLVLAHIKTIESHQHS